jgi:hypothetical protein
MGIGPDVNHHVNCIDAGAICTLVTGAEIHINDITSVWRLCTTVITYLCHRKQARPGPKTSKKERVKYSDGYLMGEVGLNGVSCVE